MANLGSAEAAMAREGLDYDGAIAWARAEIAEMTSRERDGREGVSVRLTPSRRIGAGERRRANAGYLFPRKICAELGLRDLCGAIARQEGLNLDLGGIVEQLVVDRLLEPCSRRPARRWSQELIEPSVLAERQVRCALAALARHADEIQGALYRSSARFRARRAGTLDCDCGSYVFEAETDSEEPPARNRRSSQTVQMALFMDADDIPLTFRTTPDSPGQQAARHLLERAVMDEFGRARLVVCTDAGLSPAASRVFDTAGARALICAQPIAQMRGSLRRWALDRAGWRLAGEDGTFDLDGVDEERSWRRVFYKERRSSDGRGRPQRLVATFSFQRREREASAREGRARGEGGRCDGLSCLTTSLDDDAADIIARGVRRQRIEERFRVMKHEFREGPARLGRGERIRAHLLVCFISLLASRLLELRVERAAGRAIPSEPLLRTLRDMDMVELGGEGWIPAYARDEITDALHEAVGFRTDDEIVTNRRMRAILSVSRSPEVRCGPWR